MLFVSLREACILDNQLTARINESIRSRLSPRFLHDEILQAPAIPRTLSGKKQEVPLKKLFLGYPATEIINREIMANPECIDWYLSHARARLDVAT